jgi:hypothetical protein
VQHLAQLGPCRLSITGDGTAFRQWVTELGAAQGDGHGVDTKLHVSARLGKSDFQPEVYSGKGRFNFNRREFYSVTPLPHRVRTWLGEEPCSAEFAVKEPSGRPRPLQVQPNAPLMTYASFWGLAHFTLTRKAAGFVHAAISADQNGASCFVGTGGCGKTSTLFTLLEDHAQRYQAEDFGIIDEAGYAWFSPKHVSIYASDTRSRLLDEYVRTALDFRQRGAWALRSLRGNPRIKGNPREIAQGRVADKAEIARAFYLLRTRSSAVEVRELSTAELAQRAVSVARRELAPWFESLLLIGANALGDVHFPSAQQAEEQLLALYEKAFARAEKRLVIVPHECPPDVLIAELRRNKCL